MESLCRTWLPRLQGRVGSLPGPDRASPQTTRETTRTISIHAVVVLSVDAKSKRKVGHMLREIFKECCLFILHGGMISLWQSTVSTASPLVALPQRTYCAGCFAHASW